MDEWIDSTAGGGFASERWTKVEQSENWYMLQNFASAGCSVILFACFPFVSHW